MDRLRFEGVWAITMPPAKMQYVIVVEEEGQDPVTFSAPVPDADARYLRDGILPVLRPLSDEEYMHGPAVILHTLARFSYILYQRRVYWCTEWAPGLIVVAFAPDGKMEWSAIRSPIPNFGGRKPTREDLARHDPDAENHQYNLVFDAWDAPFDETTRQSNSFERASSRTVNSYQAALQPVVRLGAQLEARYSAPSQFKKWAEKCKRNLAKWAGQGVRIP